MTMQHSLCGMRSCRTVRHGHLDLRLGTCTGCIFVLWVQRDDSGVLMVVLELHLLQAASS
jgi:hypothetical protein